MQQKGMDREKKEIIFSHFRAITTHNEIDREKETERDSKKKKGKQKVNLPQRLSPVCWIRQTQKQLIRQSYNQHLNMYGSFSPCTHLNCHAASFKEQYTSRSSLKECMMGKSLF